MARLDDNRTLEVTLSTHPRLGGRQGHERSYLLCFADNSATTFDLPERGELLVGRAPDVHFRLDDKLVSRQHARLHITSAGVHLTDLGSRHGTQVNGERVRTTRHLESGDVIAIGSATLVFHGAVRPSVTRAFLESRVLQQRLEEELERAQRYRRALSLLIVELVGDKRRARVPDQAQVVASLAGRIRAIDAVSFTHATRLTFLLPELGSQEAGHLAEDIVTALIPVAPQARAGLASCPDDALDLDTLRSCARLAAKAAGTGRLQRASELAWYRAVGEHEVLVADPAMRRVYQLIDRLATTELPILITGDTGTGKELAAAAVHHSSARASGPFVSINCGALSQSLLESELFGHVKGAFTGASTARPGVFERAHGGTLFLDELGEMSSSAQVALLRALETKRVTRLGDTRERAVDVRLVAATNRDLGEAMESGRFRRDLFFRLSTARLALPPLRDRSREIPLLAQALLARACKRMGREPLDMSLSVSHALLDYSWPGNVRELANAMQYAAATADPLDTELDIWHLPESIAASTIGTASDMTEYRSRTITPAPAPAANGPPLAEGSSDAPGDVDGPDVPVAFRPIAEEVRELEKKRMLQALAATGGRRNKAAALISMPLRTFVTKLKRYGIQKQDTQ